MHVATKLMPVVAAWTILSALSAPAAHAAMSAEELAKAAQNPIADMYYNVVRPDFAPNWQIRAQVQFMFPK